MNIAKKYFLFDLNCLSLINYVNFLEKIFSFFQLENYFFLSFYFSCKGSSRIYFHCKWIHHNSTHLLHKWQPSQVQVQFYSSQKLSICVLVQYNLHSFIVLNQANYVYFILKITKEWIEVQVSLAIRGGYVPGKLSTANTKTPVLSLK